MKVLLHDLSAKDVAKWDREIFNQEVVVVNQEESKPKKCIGCFGCWIKTPGQCVIRDGYHRMGEYLGNCNEVVIVSKCVYGEFSPFIKTLVDRTISVCHPYFVKREGKLHHKLRYDNHPKFKVYFYGDDLTPEEKNTAAGRVQAMGINFGVSECEVVFLESKEALGGMKQWL